MSSGDDETKPSSMARVPQEVLEHIAFFAATSDFLGPPAGVVPILSLNRKTYSALCMANNPHLYARIYTQKFDVEPALRRLGADKLPASALAGELRQRSVLLKRMRRREDSTVPPEGGDWLGPLLWKAYFMMLENDGKNEAQLREYALIDTWLREYWFDSSGASLAMCSLKGDEWPENTERTSLAMWLFWLLLRPDEYHHNETVFREATGILKLVALGAHRYPLCYPIWQDFIPSRHLQEPTSIVHYGMHINAIAPAPAAPAILAYLTLANKLTLSWDHMSTMKPLAPTVHSSVKSHSSAEWDGEWSRALSLGDPCVVLGNSLSGSFKPGSLEGVWEGLFTYTEFTAYAALLQGGTPNILQRSLVAQHRQTWKLREYHLCDDILEDGDLDNRVPGAVPLPPGNPSRGYIPNGTNLHEGPLELEVFVSGSQKPLVYHSWSSIRKAPERFGRVRDVFVAGEGHSAWGQFNLIGRVRPSDGFISLSKEYVDGDRGKWLYRSYMVGNANGNLSGRWRDTLSPPHVPGYEGCFVMSRRK